VNGRRDVALLLVSLLLPRAQAVAADGRPTADGAADEAALARGVELRRQRRDEEALAEFQAAYRARPSGRARAQVGLAEQALARWLDAERDIEAALASPGERWIDAHRAALERALKEVSRHNSTLRVACDTPGAEVFLDGATIGPAPLGPLRVAAGRAEIEVRAPGLAPARQVVDLVAGSEHTLSFALPPAPPAHAATPPARAESPVTLAAPPSTPDRAPTSTPAASEGATRRRTWGWSLSALGALAAVEGIGAHLLALQLAGQYNDDQRCLVGDRTREQSCSGLREGANVAQAAAFVGYAVGAAALAGGTYLLLTSRASDGPGAGVSVAAASDRLVVGVQGRF
jgi:hypothetical protein